MYWVHTSTVKDMYIRSMYISFTGMFAVRTYLLLYWYVRSTYPLLVCTLYIMICTYLLLYWYVRISFIGMLAVHMVCTQLHNDMYIYYPLLYWYVRSTYPLLLCYWYTFGNAVAVCKYLWFVALSSISVWLSHCCCCKIWLWKSRTD
jgi:hypothetical protein